MTVAHVETAADVVPTTFSLTTVAKRVFDVAGALALIVFFLPVFVLVGLVVKLHDGGPILFRQHRVGRNGQPFRIFKFRTMHPDAESRLHADAELYALFVANGCKLHPHQDPRIGPVGRFLRASSLDELPQLLNVVRGEMSLVGPRPLIGPELEEYARRGAEMAYFSVRPGLTGLWQVSGRSRLDLGQRIDLDAAYASRVSIPQDIRILFRTLRVVFSRDGAY